MDLNWMGEAYRNVRRNAAPGIDGQTVAQYGVNLVENLIDARPMIGAFVVSKPKFWHAPHAKHRRETRA